MMEKSNIVRKYIEKFKNPLDFPGEASLTGSQQQRLVSVYQT